eukprot:14569448-Heterocapsa_arctica.AAC.1
MANLLQAWPARRAPILPAKRPVGSQRSRRVPLALLPVHRARGPLRVGRALPPGSLAPPPGLQVPVR